MDVYYSYSYGTAAWCAAQALPLVVSPKLVVAMLSPSVKDASELEIYLSRSLGITLIAFGILSALLTGSVPLTSTLSSTAGGATTSESDPVAPYAFPTLVTTLVFHTASAFYQYALWVQTGVFTFVLGIASSGILAAAGLWCVLFASSDGRISRKTGADKRMSAYPFQNKEADKKRMGKKVL